MFKKPSLPKSYIFVPVFLTLITNVLVNPSFGLWDKLLDGYLKYAHAAISFETPITFTGSNDITSAKFTDSASASYYLDPASSSYALLVNGNVGIGTTAPSYKLQVVGDIYANGGWLRSSGSTGWYSESYGGGWYMLDTSWIRAYNSKNVWVDATLGANTGLTIGYGGAAAPSTGAIIAGNVGIGTTAPSYKLHVPSGYIGTDYINTTDDVSSGTISYLVGKFGDNYHRSATAAKVATFISGQTMNINGNSAVRVVTTTGSYSCATACVNSLGASWGCADAREYYGGSNPPFAGLTFTCYDGQPSYWKICTCFDANLDTHYGY